MARTDIRLDLGFLDHPKTKKLSKRLGPVAPLSLLRLWCHAARHRKSGALTNMDSDDIAIAADWDGDSGQFVEELVALGWLDRAKDGAVSIHDWEDHQPWVYGAEERSEKARRAVNSRRDRGRECTERILPVEENPTERIRNVEGTYTERSTPSPSPSPSPSPEPKDQSQHPSGPAKKASPDPAEWPDDLLPVLEELKTHGADHTDLACPDLWRSLIAWSDTQTPPLDLRPELAGYLAWQNSQPKTGQHKNLKRGFRNWCATRIRWRERDGIRQAAGGRR